MTASAKQVIGRPSSVASLVPTEFAPVQTQVGAGRRRHLHDPRHGRGIYHSFRADGTRVFEVRIEDGAGRRRFEVVGPNLAQAKARLAELQVAVSKGGKLPSLSMTVGNLANEWWTLKGEAFKPRTRDAYHLQIRKIMQRFGRTKVRDISGTDLAIWLRTTKGREALWAVLRQIFAYGVRQGYVTVSPCDTVEPSDRPRKKPADRFEGRVYADAEIAQLCSFAGRWLQEIIIVGRYTGMRLGEILALDHEAIDFDNKQIRVVGTVGLDRSIGTTKSGKQRVVPMLSESERVFRGKRGVSGPIFQTKFGDRRSVNKTSRAFSEAARRAGVEGRFHDLRHTFASKLANSPEIPIAVTSRILGHADLQTTMRYVHKIDDATLPARLEAAA